jgi:hypothetical protein
VICWAAPPAPVVGVGRAWWKPWPRARPAPLAARWAEPSSAACWAACWAASADGNTSQEKVVLDAKHFDSKARQWDENPVFRERAEKIAAGIRAAVPLSKSMTALDYGSGSGLLSFPLKDELGHITLKDTSAGMLAVAEEKIAAQGVANMSTRQTDLTAERPEDENALRPDLLVHDPAPHPGYGRDTQDFSSIS